METIHYEWSWDSNVLFPTYHKTEFEATIIHLRNISAISIDNINAAVASALANSQASNKTVEEYFKDLESIRLSDSKPITTVDNVFITVLTFVAIATSYCLFNIFSPLHTASNHCFLPIDRGSGLRCPGDVERLTNLAKK